MMRHTQRARWNPAGFSLVETTLAIALVAVIVVAILSAFSSTTIAASRYSDQARLDLLVRSDAEFIKSQPYLPQPAVYTNITAAAYTFSNQVLYYDPATNTFSTTNGENGLQEIRLTVTAPSGGVETVYLLKTQPNP